MTLDDLFRIAQNTDDTSNICKVIFDKHGGLGQSLQARFGKHLEPYEILGYMWEALPIAIGEWDETKGMASTCWAKVTWRLVRREQKRNTYCGGVRVPFARQHQYSAVQYDEKLLEVYHTDEDLDAGYN